MVHATLHFTLSTLHFPRVLPFPRDGYGQDDEWVAANFTNATEILAQGYTNWVCTATESETNGYFSLSVRIGDDPPETIQLKVGNYSVAVTNAGDYVFLLEESAGTDPAWRALMLQK